MIKKRFDFSRLLIIINIPRCKRCCICTWLDVCCPNGPVNIEQKKTQQFIAYLILDRFFMDDRDNNKDIKTHKYKRNVPCIKLHENYFGFSVAREKKSESKLENILTLTSDSTINFGYKIRVNLLVLNIFGINIKVADSRIFENN